MEPAASFLIANGSYFKTMRIQLKSGRVFNSRDRKDSPPVVLINDSFAKKYFPNENPIGQRLQPGKAGEEPVRQIVGVVGTSKHNNLAEPDEAEYYIPF